MHWTLGICTDGNNWSRVFQILRDIHQYTAFCQTIVVGGNLDSSYLRDMCSIYIPFDENQKIAWITKKKNIIAEIALHPNIVLLHDYVTISQSWYEGFEKFGDNWLTCTNPIKNLDGTRYRDWVEIYNDAWMIPPINCEVPPEYPAGRSIDYDKKPNPRWQYYSGAYGCYKKEVLLKIPFDESRVWGQGEDVQHSRNLFKEYGPDVFKFNPFSEVKLLKKKERAFWE